MAAQYTQINVNQPFKTPTSPYRPITLPQTQNMPSPYVTADQLYKDIETSVQKLTAVVNEIQKQEESAQKSLERNYETVREVKVLAQREKLTPSTFATLAVEIANIVKQTQEENSPASLEIVMNLNASLLHITIYTQLLSTCMVALNLLKKDIDALMRTTLQLLKDKTLELSKGTKEIKWHAYPSNTQQLIVATTSLENLIAYTNLASSTERNTIKATDYLAQLSPLIAILKRLIQLGTSLPNDYLKEFYRVLALSHEFSQLTHGLAKISQTLEVKTREALHQANRHLTARQYSNPESPEITNAPNTNTAPTDTGLDLLKLIATTNYPNYALNL